MTEQEVANFDNQISAPLIPTCTVINVSKLNEYTDQIWAVYVMNYYPHFINYCHD